MRVIIAFSEAFNRHDVGAIMALSAENCTIEHFEPAPDGSVYAGKGDVTRFWENHFAEHPGTQLDIEEVFGLGKRCIMRWQYRWTAEDGGECHVRGVDIFRVRDGLIQEQLSYAKGQTGLSG